jgi:hypothetical protein
MGDEMKNKQMPGQQQMPGPPGNSSQGFPLFRYVSPEKKSEKSEISEISEKSLNNSWDKLPNKKNLTSSGKSLIAISISGETEGKVTSNTSGELGEESGSITLTNNTKLSYDSYRNVGRLPSGDFGEYQGKMIRVSRSMETEENLGVTNITNEMRGVGITSNPFDAKMKDILRNYQEMNAGNTVEIFRSTFSAVIGDNRILFQGVQLDKIVAIQIHITPTVIDVEFNTSDEGKSMELQFNIPADVKGGPYDIVFRWKNQHDNHKFIQKKIYIPSGKQTQPRPLTPQEIMDTITSHFKWTGNCHQILFAPDFRECHYRDSNHANQRDPLGATDLIHAVRSLKHELVQHILDEGCNPAVATYAKEYPIHFAAEKGDIALMELLIKYGATMAVKNVRNQSPLDYAMNQKQGPDVISYIESKLVESDADMTESENNFQGSTPY